MQVLEASGDGAPAAIRWIKLEGLENHSSIAFGADIYHGRLLFSSFKLPRLKPPSEPCQGYGPLASLSSIFKSVRQKSRRPTAANSSSLSFKPVDFSPSRGTYAYEVLQRRFKELDTDDCGLISECDLKAALKILNLPASEKDIEDFMYRLGGRKQVTFEQFAEYAIQRENELVNTFKELDKQKTGYISVSGMKTALQKYRFRNTDKDIGETFNRFHIRGVLHSGRLNSKGQVLDFAEFRELLMISSIRDLRGPLEVWGRAVIDLGDVDTTFPLSSGQCLNLGLSNQRKSKHKAITHLFAGIASAGVSRTLVAPLERVKVLSMVNWNYSKDGFISLISKLWRQGGLQCFFRGNSLNVLRIAPTKIVEYIVYNGVKDLKLRNTNRIDISSTESMLLGAAASMAGMVISHPIDTVRTTLLVQLGGAERGVFDCSKAIVQKHGFAGLYRGIIPSMIRVVPYAAVNFTVYDELEKWYRRKHGPGGELGLLSSISFGVLGGAAAQILVYPLETLQRRLQAQACTDVSSLISRNMVGSFHAVIQDGGLAALYAGLLPNLLKLAPAAAISFLVYEAISKTSETQQGSVYDK